MRKEQIRYPSTAEGSRRAGPCLSSLADRRPLSAGAEAARAEASPLVGRFGGARLAAAALALALACGGPQGAGTTSDAVTTTASGRTAVDFTLRDVEGRVVRLSDHRGKVVLLNFWATWCVPCAAELPHLERLYRAYRGDGLMVLAISMDGPESIAAVGPQVRQYGLTFPVLLDEETRVVGVYNPKRAAPFTTLIGRDGVVTRSREGYSAGDEVALEADLRALLVRK